MRGADKFNYLCGFYLPRLRRNLFGLLNLLVLGNLKIKIYHPKVLGLLLAALGLALLFLLPSTKSKTDYRMAPEMKDILGSDQEVRLKATRKLVERVDVEAALEILEHSPLPHTGEGHLEVHQIGFHAYRKYGIDSILRCKDYFLYACYHGAIIEAATDQGFEAVAKMTDRCK